MIHLPHFRRYKAAFLLLILLRLYQLLCTGGAAVSAQLLLNRVEGLSQNTVYALTQDSLGFLWIGTGNGINRFDGHDMTSYLPVATQEADGLSGRFVRNGFLTDAAGNLWFATENGTQYLHRRSGNIKACMIQLQGRRTRLQGTYPLATEGSRYWLVNESSGLFLYDPARETAERYPVPVVNGRSVPLQLKGAPDNKGGFWFATGSGLFCFDRADKQWKRLLPDKAFATVAVQGDTVLASSGTQVYFFLPAEERWGVLPKSEGASPARISVMYSAPNGAVWMGDDKGNLYVLASGAAAVQWMGNINAAGQQGPAHPVYSIFSGNDGSLWIGADVLGLLQVKTSNSLFYRFPYTTRPELEDYFVQSILPVDSSRVLLGLYQRGVQELNLSDGRTRPLTPPCSGNRPNQNATLLHREADSSLWIFSCGVLYRQEQGRGVLHTLALPLPGGLVLTEKEQITVRAVAPYDNGWLLATNLGLYRVVRQNGRLLATHVTSLGYTFIADIWIHPQEQSIWLGLETGGIAILQDLSGPAARRYLPGQESNSIKQFAYNPAAPDRLWAATLSGLLCIHLPTLQHRLYTQANGLPANYLLSVVQAGNELWVSSNTGLSRVQWPASRSALFPELLFENYNRLDGLLSDAFNSGAGVYQPGGPLYFGSSAGLVWLYPGRFQLPQSRVPVRLVDFQVNERRYSDTVLPEWLSDVRLHWKEQSLYFKFSGVIFADATKLQYRYYLHNWDRQWNYSGSVNEVRYSRLPPGHYTFYAAVRYQGSRWSQPLVLRVTIVPPFWQRPYFYVPLAVLLLVAVVLLIRFLIRRRYQAALARLRRQQELEEERQRISREMHDDVGAGLTQITLMSEALARQQHDTKAEQIAGVSRKLMQHMSEIIWSLNQEAGRLQDLFAYMREQLGLLAEHAAAELIIEFPETPVNPVLPFELKRNLLLLVKEAVNNAVKHSGATRIEVQAVVEGDCLAFRIQDNGRGFEPGHNSQGNGLRNMNTRAQRLGSVLELHAAPGRGTTVQVRVRVPELLPKSH
jgi:signal transduction histidine kinase/ligand-binding sensor domain-containing protein